MCNDYEQHILWAELMQAPEIEPMTQTYHRLRQ